MTDGTDFLSQAWYTIARAIAAAGVNADMDKAPETIAESVNRRVRAELRRLAVLLRRLIFLMALQMELAPLPPRVGGNYREPKTPGADYRYVFATMPASAGPGRYVPKGPQPAPGRAPVPAARLIARWHAMLDTLKHHKRRAKRLARTIRRWQAAGEARPHVLPLRHAHRMPAAVALISGGLAVQLTEALKNWPEPDTG